MQQKSSFPAVGAAEWRKLVEKELAGAPFEKALTTATPEGLTLQPLYWEALPAPAAVRAAHPWRVCPHVGDAPGAREEIEGGATALWVNVKPGEGLPEFHELPADVTVVLDSGGDIAATARVAREAIATAAFGDATATCLTLAADPLGAAALSGKPPVLDGLAALVAAAPREPRLMVVSTLPYHGAGADAAQELGFALATAVAYLRALEAAGLDVAAAAAKLGFRVAVGRDTFAELAKLRALRVCWAKLCAAAGITDAPAAHVHAVASPRTMSQRDPWVNMLRVTTEVFAAILGGADLVTPEPFDAALAQPGALGRRVARNTALVLGQESFLGRVADPAGGSYYLESLTDGLARAGWAAFQAIEAAGGMAAALASGHVRSLCEASWKKRQDALAKRKEPLTGVSEFANLAEKLPSAPRRAPAAQGATTAGLPQHRDAEAFERLRDLADAATAAGHAPRVVLAPLGPLAEHKPRASFAQNFFQAGGFRVDEDASDPADAAAVCLCGSDERYAAEAVEAARLLRASGAKRVFLAGRPGALEPLLAEAGVSGYIFVGCDVVATLGALLESSR
jgi:methylmalonyl-CoA mutase